MHLRLEILYLYGFKLLFGLHRNITRQSTSVLSSQK